MQSETSGFVAKRLVLLGGGHSHLSVLKNLGMKPLPGVQITLIMKDIHAPYSGMVPGYVSGFYSFDECHIDLSKLATFAKARLLHAGATAIDTCAREVHFADRPAVPYDCLSIDIGITPDLTSVPGAAQHVTPVKPINEFIQRVDMVINRLRSRKAGTASVVVVGGGAGGVEIAFSIHFRATQLAERESPGADDESPHECRQDGGAAPPPAKVTLVSRGPILPSHPGRARTIILERARACGIEVVEGPGVTRVDSGRLTLDNGTTLMFDECLWCTSAAPAAWLQHVDLPKAQGGFLAINEFLRSAGGPPNVFAAGDVATSLVDPRPKAGVFAVRQGPALAENIRRYLTGRPLRPFHPQRHFLSLISTGERFAVATNFGLALSGAWLWTWKDKIDRAFMDKFGQELPHMENDSAAHQPEALHDSGADVLAAWAAARMRCGGCAAKVSASVLKRVLQRLPTTPSPHVITSLSSPDDAAVLAPPPPKHVLVQTTDFLRAFTSDPFVFGQITAQHALSDCFAMGAEPTSALAVAVVPFAADPIMEDSLFQMLAGAQEVLDRAGCALVGGHSCEGAEMSLGFAVTGSVKEDAVMTKGALRPGHVLVLTKPLGTGLLLKAEMTRQGKGRWVAAALDAMRTSNGPAARVMQEHGVCACTDVTGFGLLGHLAEMASASGVQIELHAAAVPVLEGVLEVVEMGVRSSLHEQNSKSALMVTNAEAAMTAPCWPVLTDPQTSGGLVCGIDESQASKLVEALKQSGCIEAAVIGRVTGLSTDSSSVQCITCLVP